MKQVMIDGEDGARNTEEVKRIGEFVLLGDRLSIERMKEELVKQFRDVKIMHRRKKI